jgi:hypothetical protein
MTNLMQTEANYLMNSCNYILKLKLDLTKD